MSKRSFDDYAYHAWTTAFFLDNPDPAARNDAVFYGYNEEVSELLDDEDYPRELTATLWGWDVDADIAAYLQQSKTSEAGDILYYVTASGMLRNVPLRDMMHQAVERYTGAAAIGVDTFEDFDARLQDRMSPAVPTDYRPNYHTWTLWDFAPFEDTLHIVMAEPAYAKGPLTLIGDGRYALERLHRTFGRFMLPEHGSAEEYIASASLVLGGLSIVLQHRFDSSLAAAVDNNIDKRERRAAAQSLAAGQDAERSRPIDQPRPRPSSDDITAHHLHNAPFPPPDAT